ACVTTCAPVACAGAASGAPVAGALIVATVNAVASTARPIAERFRVTSAIRGLLAASALHIGLGPRNLVPLDGLHPRERACKMLTTRINALIGADGARVRRAASASDQRGFPGVSQGRRDRVGGVRWWRRRGGRSRSPDSPR